jgi:hypothetical protein
MSLAAITDLALDNQVLIVSVLLALSETLGANPKIKSNGILSFILIQAQAALKKEGAKEI